MLKIIFSDAWVFFYSKLDLGSYIVQVARTVFISIFLTGSIKFLSPKFMFCLYKTIIDFLWNTVLLSVLVLLIAAFIFFKAT